MRRRKVGDKDQRRIRRIEKTMRGRRNWSIKKEITGDRDEIAGEMRM